MRRWWKTNPARVFAVVNALAAVVFSLVDVPEPTQAALLALCAVLAGEGTRSQVYAPATVEKLTAPPGGQP